MMLEHLGEEEAAAAVLDAIEAMLAERRPAHARSRRHGEHRRRDRRAGREFCEPLTGAWSPEMSEGEKSHGDALERIAGVGTTARSASRS